MLGLRSFLRVTIFASDVSDIKVIALSIRGRGTVPGAASFWAGLSFVHWRMLDIYRGTYLFV